MYYDDWILFRVPIYKESREEYNYQLHVRLEKRVKSYIEKAKHIGIGTARDYEIYWLDNPPPLNPEKITWKYNRIIGWIEFYADGMKIKTNLYLIRGRATWALRNVIIDYRGKLADVADAYYRDNEQLIERIGKFLTEVQRGRYGKKLARYRLDVDDTLRLLRYTDIKGLLQDLKDDRWGRKDAQQSGTPDHP